VPGISDKPGHEIAEKVPETTMAGMFNLGNILELVRDGFDDGTLTQEQFVQVRQQFVVHVLFEFGNELQIMGEECIKEPLGQIAFVRKQLAPALVEYSRRWGAVIDIPWGETAAEQGAFIVDDQMQFEAIKPA